MIQESLAYRFVYMIYSFFARVWPESLSARVLKKCGAFFSRLFSGSWILHVIGREGVVNRTYEHSGLYRLVDGVFNLPQRLLHPLYKKAETVFEGSVLFRVVLFLIQKLHLLTAGFLFIVLVVKYARWNNTYSTIAVVLLLLLFFLRSVVEGRTGFDTAAVNVFFVLFVFSILLAEVFSIMPAESLRFLAYYLTGFLMFITVIVNVRTRKELSEFLAVILSGFVIACAFGVYQYIIKVPVNPAWTDTMNEGSGTRVYSFFNNPNDFAEVILLFVPFCFAAAFNAKRLFAKLFFLAMAAPALLSLLLTQARGAWIAIVITAFVYVMFKEKRMLPVLLVLGVAAIPFLPDFILLRIRTILTLSDTSILTRLDIWKTVLPILEDYWYTGLGLGNETLLRVAKNYTIFTDKGSIPSHSHNLFLQLWLETGLPGIATFLAFVLTTVKKSIRSIVQRKDDYTRNILIAGLAAIAGFLADGMIEYVWFDRRVMLFFWVVVGILYAVFSIRAKEEKEADGENALDKPVLGNEEVA